MKRLCCLCKIFCFVSIFVVYCSGTEGDQLPVHVGKLLRHSLLSRSAALHANRWRHHTVRSSAPLRMRTKRTCFRSPVRRSLSTVGSCTRRLRSSSSSSSSTLCLKKGCNFYFCNNFGKFRPILIILSLLYSQIYCWGRWYCNHHLTSSLLPHYLAKLESATVQLYKKVIKLNMVQ